MSTSSGSMKGRDYFGLAFGSMIGIGWVVSAPLWISNAGSIGAMIAMALTALIVIPVGLVYSEMSTSVRMKGGEFAFAHYFIGRKSGFACGWFLVLGYLTILPWVALSVAAMIAYVFPALESIPLYTVLDNTIYLPELIVGLVMVWGLAALNLKGVKASKTFQTVATALLLITFVIFFIGCFVTGRFENLQPYFSSNGTAGGILAAIASMLFFMNGFDTIPKAADEAASGTNMKNLAKALIGTIVLGSVVYLFVILSASLIMVPGESVNLGSLPLISAYELSTGSKLLVYIMIFGTIMGVTTTFNGFLLAGSKLLASFARAGFMSRSVGEENAAGIPSRALVILALLSTAGLFVGKGLLTPLITMGGIAFLVAWFFVGCSTLRFRDKEPGTPRPFKTPGGKPMICLSIIITAALTLAMVLPGTLISLGVTENVLLAIWVVLGIVVYAIYRKQEIVIERLPVAARAVEASADDAHPRGTQGGTPVSATA